MKNKFILLVDADGDCEEPVALAAAQTDHDLWWVKTSREAFPILSQQIRQQLAAVIVDVDPGAHGLALLEAISSCAERPPMLVLTALEETYMEPIAKRHGAVACLGKPIGRTSLRAVLRNVNAQRSVSSDLWGHPTAPPVDLGWKVKAALRGISRKLSVAAPQRNRAATQRKGASRTRGAETMKRNDIRNILLPTDFSPLSIEAIEMAKGVARYFGATIHLAHVHHEQYPATFMGPVFSEGGRAVSFEERRKETLREMLKELAQRCELPSTETVHLRAGGVVFDEICRLAGKLPADLIVMSTHGRTGLQHFFLGSTAERVVQHAPCPVLVTRARQTRAKAKRSARAAVSRMETILVPIDFSGASRQALDYAIDFAGRVSARLFLFHAAYLGDMTSVDGFVQPSADLTKIAREDAEQRMQELVGTINLQGVPYETAVQVGSPVPEICEFAQDHNVDLIIAATHGRTGFEHLMIGSVAEQVVRRAGCSVLVVPSHPKARMAGLTRRAARVRQKKEASMTA